MPITIPGQNGRGVGRQPKDATTHCQWTRLWNGGDSDSRQRRVVLPALWSEGAVDIKGYFENTGAVEYVEYSNNRVVRRSRCSHQ